MCRNFKGRIDKRNSCINVYNGTNERNEQYGHDAKRDLYSHEYAVPIEATMQRSDEGANNVPCLCVDKYYIRPKGKRARGEIFTRAFAAVTSPFAICWCVLLCAFSDHEFMMRHFEYDVRKGTHIQMRRFDTYCTRNLMQLSNNQMRGIRFVSQFGGVFTMANAIYFNRIFLLSSHLQRMRENLLQKILLIVGYEKVCN